MSFLGFQPRAQLQNYTMIPNEFFDSALEQINSLAELKIILAIFRKTYGWVDKVENGVVLYKVEDDISYSQFHALTGLSDVSISDGIKRSVEHGFVEKVKEGGFHQGSNRFRIAQRGVSGEGTAKVKEAPKLGTLDTQQEKEIALAELRGVAKEPPEEAKTNSKITFSEKPLEKWNCNDLLCYFGHKYKDTFKIPYAVFSVKDRSLAKKLLGESGLNVHDIVKVIDYYILNYRTIRGLPEGFPSWAVFYGWRNALFPLALVGEDLASTKASKNVSIREYQAVANTWVPTSWE